MNAGRQGRVTRAVATVMIVALLTIMVPDAALARTPLWIKRVGNVARRIVNAPGRVATWSTRWMGPVLGPAAAIWLTGRIVANGDVGRIVRRAGNIERATRDAQFLGDSVDRLRRVYSAEAEENRKLSQEIEKLIAEIKQDPGMGDVGRLMDLRRMQAGYDRVAQRLDERSRSVDTGDVIKLLGNNALRRVAGSAEAVVNETIGRELQRLVNRDVLVVLSGDGLDPQVVLNGIVQRDAQRMLSGTQYAGDKDFEDRFREALEARLRQDRQFLRTNWRSEVDRMIAEIARRVAAERGEVPTKTASVEETVTEEQIGVDPEEATAGILPGDEAEPTAPSADSIAPLEGIAKDKQWVVWVAADVGFKPILIQTYAAYETPTPGESFPGGGMSSEPIRKQVVGGPFASIDEARSWVKGQLSEIGYASGIYAGMPVAQFQGETHNLELLGFDPSK